MRMDIDELRAQTPGCAGRIHLNNAGAALISQPTLDAITAHLRREAEIGGDEAVSGADALLALTPVGGYDPGGERRWAAGGVGSTPWGRLAIRTGHEPTSRM